MFARRCDASAVDGGRDDRRRPPGRDVVAIDAGGRDERRARRGPAAVLHHRGLGRRRAVNRQDARRWPCQRRLTGASAPSFELPGTAADVQMSPGAITRTPHPGRHASRSDVGRGNHARLSWATERWRRRPRESADGGRREDAGQPAGRRSARDVACGRAVLAGQPERVELTVPDGFVVTGASGGTRGNRGASWCLVLRLSRPARTQPSVPRQPRATGLRDRSARVAPADSDRRRARNGRGGRRSRRDRRIASRKPTSSAAWTYAKRARADGSLAGHAVLAALRYHRRAPDPPSSRSTSRGLPMPR